MTLYIHILLILHDNGVLSIKCKQGTQLSLWVIVCIKTVFMLINESELSKCTNEYIAQ